MQKRRQLLFTAAFVLMLVLPYPLYVLLSGLTDRTNYENRTLTTWQDVLTASFSQKPSAFEEFLGDHAAFRNEFMTLNAGIDYRLFHTVQSGEVLLGKENWLFYRNVEDSASLDDYQGLNVYPPEQMAELARALTALSDKLAARGTRFVLLLAPNKERVYARYMPDSVPVVGRTKADVLVEYLRANTAVEVLYPLEQLRQESKARQVYYKYDTHWNNAGALLAARQLSEAFAGCTAVSAQGEPLQDLAYVSATYRTLPADVFFAVEGTPTPTGQSLLMLHDSFGLALQPLLEQAYGCTFVNYNAFNTLDMNLPCDVFVMEVAERYTNQLLPCAQRMAAQMG